MATDILQSVFPALNIPAWVIIVASLWSLIWKGIALWISAKKNQKIWFIVLLVFNTLGILEILYIFLFSKIKLDNKPNRRRKR